MIEMRWLRRWQPLVLGSYNPATDKFVPGDHGDPDDGQWIDVLQYRQCPSVYVVPDDWPEDKEYEPPWSDWQDVPHTGREPQKESGK